MQGLAGSGDERGAEEGDTPNTEGGALRSSQHTRGDDGVPRKQEWLVQQQCACTRSVARLAPISRGNATRCTYVKSLASSSSAIEVQANRWHMSATIGMRPPGKTAGFSIAKLEIKTPLVLYKRLS